MPWVFSTLLATRICSSRPAWWGEPDAAIGTPGAHGELQAAVVAVTGVGGPVAARLAGRDCIPVHTAVRIRSAGRQRHRCEGQRPRDGGQPERCADVLHFFPFAKRAPTTPARAGADAVQAGDLGRAVSVRHDKGSDTSPHRASSPAAAKGDHASAGPTHTQVRGLKLFARFRVVWKVQSDLGKVISE